MTENLIIVPYNDHDDADLSLDVTAVAGFEPENTQNTIRESTLRTTAAFVMTCVVPETRTASAFGIFRHKLLGCTIALQFYSDAAATSTVGAVISSSAQWWTASEPYTWSRGSNDPFAVRAPYRTLFSERSYRSYKITVSGTPTEVDYYELSRIWMGRGFQPARTAARGLQFGQDDQTDSLRTVGGSLRANGGESYRRLAFDLNGINEDEFATWVDIREQVGRHGDVMVSIFPNDGTRREALHTIAGRMVSLNDIGRPTRLMTQKIQIEEN